MNAEVLAMGEAGFGARTEEDWYAALNALHADRALASRMGRNGRAIAEEHFSVRPVAAKIAAVLRSLA
jgi:glycosyltransferase involved in cell wall biosynthesis